MVVNRFYIRCSTCQEKHTLRITVGTDKHQKHTFSCVNCGEDLSVRLDVFFEDRYNVTNIEGISFPKSKLSTIDNCELSDKEGTIVNLFQTF